MIHSLEDQSSVIRFQSAQERDAEAQKQYILEQLEEVRQQVLNEEVISFAVALEKSDMAIFTSFTGGFNPVLIGAVSHLLWRLNEVD